VTTTSLQTEPAPSKTIPFPFRRFGDRRWDLFLHATGFAALIGIVVVQLIPDSAPLVWLAVLGIPANSPLSPLLPTAFEPVIMDAAKHASVLGVTLVSTGIYMYTEYLNWYLYAWVLNWDRFRPLSEGRWVKLGMRWFAAAPFTTVVVFAFTPLPFWAARCLAILDRYSLKKFMWGTAVGRLPRFFLYAWLGSVLGVPTIALVGVVVGTAVIVIAARLVARRPLLVETALDRAAGRDPLDRASD